MVVEMSGGKTEPTAFRQRLVGIAQWFIGLAIVAMVGAVSWTIVHAIIDGPKMRAIAESREAGEIAREDRAFCAKVGIHFAAPEFATCADVLGQVRRLELERFNRDSGIL
jgi:hypothetical protein